LLNLKRDMKTICQCAVVLCLLVGCATGVQVTSEPDRRPAVVASAPEPAPVASPKPLPIVRSELPPNVKVVEQKAPPVAERVTPPLVAKAPPRPIEEDDDISALLAPEEFQKFDIPIVFNDAVKYYIGWFTTEKRKVFGNWLRRARWYVPVIREILKEHGLPEDLVYLAMIESGFNPKAYSTAKACGPWQFIYATGGRYGLKVNNWVDERRDPQKSTVAAAKYLKDLFNQFGCWYLAAAGYNAGEKRVERAIEKHNTNDFWELSKYNALPRETREYIPKLIAAAIIAKDPEKFGFGAIQYDQPLRFVETRVPSATPLKVIAKLASMEVEDLRAMNPEIIWGITPPDVENYKIKLPWEMNRQIFRDRLETAMASEKKIRSVITYKTRKGDTLAKILKRYKLREEDYALLNGCDEDLKVRPGMVVQIPRFGSGSQKINLAGMAGAKTASPEKAAGKKETVANKAKHEEGEKESNKTAYHVVKKGETLAMISSKYGIDVGAIKLGNNLKGDKVYPNMKLKLVGYVTGKKAPPVKYHIVKKGETLSAISSKYDVDVADLKSANNLKGDRVVPKMKLRIISSEG
jgi:membrane-bound lytic murein transglycosylase D